MAKMYANVYTEDEIIAQKQLNKNTGQRDDPLLMQAEAEMVEDPLASINQPDIAEEIPAPAPVAVAPTPPVIEDPLAKNYEQVIADTEKAQTGTTDEDATSLQDALLEQKAQGEEDVLQYKSDEAAAMLPGFQSLANMGKLISAQAQGKDTTGMGILDDTGMGKKTSTDVLAEITKYRQEETNRRQQINIAESRRKKTAEESLKLIDDVRSDIDKLRPDQSKLSELVDSINSLSLQKIKQTVVLFTKLIANNTAQLSDTDVRLNAIQNFEQWKGEWMNWLKSNPNEKVNPMAARLLLEQVNAFTVNRAKYMDELLDAAKFQGVNVPLYGDDFKPGNYGDAIIERYRRETKKNLHPYEFNPGYDKGKQMTKDKVKSVEYKQDAKERTSLGD